MKFDKDITKIKRVTFFWDTVYTNQSARKRTGEGGQRARYRLNK